MGFLPPSEQGEKIKLLAVDCSEFSGESHYLNKSYFLIFLQAAKVNDFSLKLITESELALFPSASLAL